MAKSDFFTQSESEEIFIRGISDGTDKDGVTQKELTDASKKILGQLGKTAPSANQKKAAETKDKTFHHSVQNCIKEHIHQKKGISHLVTQKNYLEMYMTATSLLMNGLNGFLPHLGLIIPIQIRVKVTKEKMDYMGKNIFS